MTVVPEKLLQETVMLLTRSALIGLSLWLIAPVARTMQEQSLELEGMPLAKDPGVRPENLGTGVPLEGLTEHDLQIFEVGRQRFQEVESTSEDFQDAPVGTVVAPGLTNSAGLGGRFNSNQCSSCHAFPTIGGTSPHKNPLFEVATARGATNKVPSFELPEGPIREVRLIYDEDGNRHGGVINLFTAKGRYDAPMCNLDQPDFEKLSADNNISFRIPTPVFGLGLVESIPDREILSHMRSNPIQKAALGITGHPNRSAHTGTISRFGWKAQNESLMMFAGEAYNVEMGVTNELFPTSRTEESKSIFGEPFDVMRTEEINAFTPLNIHATWVLFGEFMRFLAPPVPAPADARIEKGEQVFKEIGCAYCHVPSMYTLNKADGGPRISAHAGKRVDLYSDLLVHHMGSKLADNIIQGQAGPDEFRTAPLWGLSQRIFFLHDGRTNDLDVAIREHYSDETPADDLRRTPAYPASEANQVVKNYETLKETDKQLLLEFLRAI